MKTLPTLRKKKRYMAFEIASEQIISRGEIMEEILNSVHSLFGDTGLSEMNLALLSFDGRYGLVRCVKEKNKETRAALACINEVRGNPVSIVVLGISGTIKGAMEKFIQQSLITGSEPENDDKQEHPIHWVAEK